LEKDYGAETFAKWAGSLLSAELDAREFRGLDFEAAEREAKDQAERMAESQVFEAVEENLPDGEEEDWNWEALAKFANARWNTNLRDRDLKKVGRDGVTELLLEQGKAAINKIDLGEGKRFLEPDFGMRTACGWVHYKFGIAVDFHKVRDLEPGEFKELLGQKSREMYDEKEAEYPVMAGFYRFTMRDSAGQKRYDRDQLVNWARERFHVDLTLDQFKNKTHDEVRPILVSHSRDSLQKAANVRADLEKLIDDVFAKAGGSLADTNGAAAGITAGSSTATLSLQKLVDQLKSLDPDLTEDEIKKSNHEQLARLTSLVVDEHYRPEMRRMERSLVLQILDAAWKDHLLAMDHLRSSVSLRGYAQVDPKVEYKREGMKLFEAMWVSIGDRVTDLFFKLEQLDESFVGSTWKETAAIHEEAPSQSDISQQQQAAIEGSQGQAQKLEPIRNRGEKVGRNDPCPCGSGKKYKNCCMRSIRTVA
jgi:preprotein translocase subunit SecA